MTTYLFEQLTTASAMASVAVSARGQRNYRDVRGFESRLKQ